LRKALLPMVSLVRQSSRVSQKKIGVTDYKRTSGSRVMRTRVKQLNPMGRDGSAGELGLVAALLASAIAVALMAVGGPIVGLVGWIFGAGI